MAGLVQLNLSKKDPPKLEEVVDREKFLKHLAEWNIEKYQHVDGKTEVYGYTVKCEQTGAWDEVTRLCNGLVVREGRVVGRPYPKFFLKDTPGLPETMPENFEARPEVTEMLDGVQATMYPDLSGSGWNLAVRKGFFEPPVVWGNYLLRSKMRKDIVWPLGFSPVVQVVGHRWKKICPVTETKIVLVALVDLRTGWEMRYGEMADWAEWNEMPVVGLFPQDPSLAVEPISGLQRGYVFKWAREQGSPFRVGCEAMWYQKLKGALGDVTPLVIWKMLSEGGSLEVYRASTLPEPFVRWVTGWEYQLKRRKEQVEREAKELFDSCKFEKVPPPPEERKKYTAKLVATIPTEKLEKGHTSAMLFAMLDGRPVDRYSWQEARVLAAEGKSYSEDGKGGGV